MYLSLCINSSGWRTLPRGSEEITKMFGNSVRFQWRRCT